MALNTRGTTGSNRTYLNIYQGNMVLEYDTQEALEKKLESLGLDPEYIKVRQRTKGKNEGKDVYYYALYDLSGKLTNIRMNVNDFGEFVELEFTDVEEKYSVSLGDVYSRICKDFIRRVGNIDLQKEMVFGVWNITAEESNNGKSRSGVKMYQDDTKLEYFISHEEMPEPTSKKKGNKTTWNYDDQEQYLYEALIAFKDENFLDEEVDKELPEKKEPIKKNVSRKPSATVTETDGLPF